MKVIIASGGKAPSRELTYEELKDSKYLICADSGANYLYDYSIVPDFLMGDFDSIDTHKLNYFKDKNCEILNFPVEKDCTDTELALDKAIELGATEITFIGCTGTRIDHTLGNIGLLKKCIENNILAYIKDDHNTVFLVNKPTVLKGRKGDIFSLQAYCDVVNDLSILGAKYPLTKYRLKIGDGITISNEFISDEVEIDFSHGRLIILYSKD